MISARLRTLDSLRGSRSKHLDPPFVHVSTLVRRRAGVPYSTEINDIPYSDGPADQGWNHDLGRAEWKPEAVRFAFNDIDRAMQN
jgi:hypothetical protein